MRAMVWLVGGAAAVGAFVLARRASAQAAAPIHAPPFLQNVPLATTGSSRVWMPVPVSFTQPNNGGDRVYVLTAGQTYRATARVDTTWPAPSVSKSLIEGFVADNPAPGDFAKITAYGPSDTLPADWPDVENAGDVWYVEATPTANFHVPESQSAIIASGKLLSLYVATQVSDTKPTQTTTLEDSGGVLHLEPGSVLRVQLPESNDPTIEGWFFSEYGPIAEIVAQSSDGFSLYVDVRILAGKGTLVAAQRDQTGRAVDGWDLGIIAQAPTSPATGAA